MLLIDGDPQGSLTISLGHPQPDKLPFTLSDAMGRLLMDEPIKPGAGILHHSDVYKRQPVPPFPTQPPGCVGAPSDWLDLPGRPGQIVTRHWARGTEVPWAACGAARLRPTLALPTTAPPGG